MRTKRKRLERVNGDKGITVSLRADDDLCRAIHEVTSFLGTGAGRSSTHPYLSIWANIIISFIS
ncbi:hypothetical protein [uncultured Virgibacillus sp.]|uniref:hypothetical protein n=1 Tax=uncultured Virgibacillus sp. TaxID=417355 RepID=UPI0026203FFD|nr:hypothetical protein [uncultured Virgibacillus sp.]